MTAALHRRWRWAAILVGCSLAGLGAAAAATPAANAALINDPLYPSQWGLNNVGQPVRAGAKFTSGRVDMDINAPEAWMISKGAGVMVAVIDEGAWVRHPELIRRAAPTLDDSVAEPAAYPANFNFDNNSGQLIPGAHGTHVAGIIAAEQGNGVGGSGVAPDAGIVSIQTTDYNGELGGVLEGDVARVVARSMRLAGSWGIRVANISLGWSAESEPGVRAITRAASASPNTMFVVAAGNEKTDLDRRGKAVLPCSVPADNIVCVGSMDSRGRRSSFSNFGRKSVDLFAPGETIYSSSTQGWHSYKTPRDYEVMSGTSMASPMVAGTVALMVAANPAATTSQLRRALLGTVDRSRTFAKVSVTGGRANAYRAVRAVQDPDKDGTIALDDEGWAQ